MMTVDKTVSTAIRSCKSLVERVLFLSSAPAAAEGLQPAPSSPTPDPVALPATTQRPAWLREGVVGAWHMEALEFYKRRGYATVYGGGPSDFTKLWKEAFHEDTVKHYKEMGINLVIMPLHKGAGLKAEAESIEATRKFTELAHRYDIRVGGYLGSTMMYETFYFEEPSARSWEQIDERGRPIYYGPQTFRHAACRNNPGYQAFIQKVLRLGILDLKLDSIHFDQAQWYAEPGSCHCKYCQEGFRAYLRKKYTDSELKARLGFTILDGIRVPDFNLDGPPVRIPELKDPLMQEWARFRCATLAQWWSDTHAYIRQLNPEVVLNGNPTLYFELNHGFIYGVDPDTFLPHGEMVSSEEGNEPIWTPDERLVSRIRTFKAARTMGPSLIVWNRIGGRQGIYPPSKDEDLLVLGVAENLAYNDANLGVWNSEEAEEPPAKVRPYNDFLRSHIKDLINTAPVADVAVLRSFASTQFNPAKALVSTALFEQMLIQCKFPFTIIFESHLRDLSKYKVLVVANQDALSDEQTGQIRQFVEAGGGLVATEEASVLTEWRRKRNKFGLAEVLGIDEPPKDKEEMNSMRREFGKGRVVYIPRIEPEVEPPPPMMTYYFGNKYWKLPKNYEDLAEAVRWAGREKFSVKVEAPLWVTMELAAQPASKTWLLHLVNFKIDEPLREIPVQLRIPEGMRLREAVFETPDRPSRAALDVAQQQGVLIFVVPRLQVYSVVFLRMDAGSPVR